MNDSTQKTSQKLIVYMCLGFALNKQDGKVTMADELIQRLDYLAEMYKKQDQVKEMSTKNVIFMSGRGKVDIESKYMKRYLVEQYGINDEDIFEEKYSMNTVENFLFCLFKLWKDNELSDNTKSKENTFEMRIITSQFHLKRVEYIASAVYKLISPTFKHSILSPFTYFGAQTSNHKVDEAAILWEKATEKINRIFSFNYDLTKFMEEREFDEEDKQKFIIFKDEILKNIQQ